MTSRMRRSNILWMSLQRHEKWGGSLTAEVAEHQVERVEEDDSWMDGTADTGGNSTRRRKGGKKK